MRAVLALVLTIWPAAAGQQPPATARSQQLPAGTPSRNTQRFQEAITLMDTRGDCAAAVRLFQEVVNAKGTDRATAAQAWVYVGVCRERMGQVEATKAYRTVIDQFGDQPGPVKQARERLANIDRRGGNGRAVHSRRAAWAAPLDLPIEMFGLPATGGGLIPWIEGNRPEEVTVADLETATVRRRLLARPRGATGGAIESGIPPILSPNGSEAAFVWGGEAFQLCVTGSDDRVRVLATAEKGESVAPLEWRTGGLMVSITRPGRPTRLLVMSPADGTVRWSVQVEGAFPHPTLSPDGRFLAFEAPFGPAPSARDIFVAASTGGDPVHLVAGEADDFFPTWSPDSHHILFVSDRAGPNGLWEIQVNDGHAAAAPRLLERDIGEVVRPLGITAAGAYYYLRQVGLANVYLVELDKDGRPLGPPAPVDPRLGGLSLGPSWGPDGQLVYVTSASASTVSIMDPARGTARRLQTGMAVLRGTNWSPDGQSILVSGVDRSGVEGSFLIDQNSGTPRHVTCAAGGDQGLRSWTPDSQALACQQGAAVIRRPLDGGEPQELFRLPAAARVAGIPNLMASRRTGRFAFALRTGEALTLNVQTPASGIEEVFRQGKNEPMSGVDWMPDDRALVFVRGQNNWPTPPGQDPPSAWVISLDDRRPKPLGIAMDGLRNLRVSPDGRHLAFTAGWLSQEVTVLEHILPK